MPRYNFTAKTKQNLAGRAGQKCSFLGCGISTIGPSRENNNTEPNNTGEAAHIYSASQGKGARRKAPASMSKDEIKSIHNGIWMCASHARQIDRDEVTFTVHQLRKWKDIAEDVAREMQTARAAYQEAIVKLSTKYTNLPQELEQAQREDKLSINDSALYKKILEMIPEPVRYVARNGGYINTHEESLRKPLCDYYDYLENNPVTFKFHDSQLQEYKELLDHALIKLFNILADVTFYEPPDNRETGEGTYAMSQELKFSAEGSRQYSLNAKKIQEFSLNFIDAFDELHSVCRTKFAE